MRGVDGYTESIFTMSKLALSSRMKARCRWRPLTVDQVSILIHLTSPNQPSLSVYRISCELLYRPAKTGYVASGEVDTATFGSSTRFPTTSA
ncbi:hypothetical protein SAMN05446935_7750 [Burkholderia sp. YR290]|nr:hypothetical protein SAMN05446935_7750 [Burkholderia sp. YR290]